MKLDNINSAKTAFDLAMSEVNAGTSNSSEGCKKPIPKKLLRSRRNQNNCRSQYLTPFSFTIPEDKNAIKCFTVSFIRIQPLKTYCPTDISDKLIYCKPVTRDIMKGLRTEPNADDGQGQDEADEFEYDEANGALPDWEYLNAHLPQNFLNGVQKVPIALAPRMEVEVGPIIEVEIPQDIYQNVGVPAQPELIVYELQDRPIEFQNDDHAPGPIPLRRVRTTMAEISDICGRLKGSHDTGFVSKDQLLEYRVHDPETREPLVLPFNGSTNMRNWSRCQVQEFLSQIVFPDAAQSIARRCPNESELEMFEAKTVQFFEELNSLATHKDQKIQWREYKKIAREVGEVRRVQLMGN
ncbi:hypothetical protein L3Y34_010589 [Caenorhabditis briggsae]|uniref:Uncharacterized protein n=1 Tax=Caenorhabditis briggsae TaxID=6238 RepID=A0AAE8ZPL8_CAEBR|nr:hypothetical protein L3Y34_010589 [Caenorhabditis briggsae]